MARTCTACRHKQAKELNKALMKGEPVRDIAERFGLKPTAVQKHKAHISALISERKEEVTTSALQDIKRYIQRAETLWRACDRFLRDPDNPDEYDLGPRDRDIEVIYEEKVPAADGFKSVMKRAMLSQLLDKTGKHVIGSRYRVADPRELVLKSLERLESQLKILGGLTGEIKPSIGTAVQVNIQQQVIDSLPTVWEVLSEEDFPEARAALIARLKG